VTAKDERNDLTATVARLLADRAPIEAMPTVAATRVGYDPALWRELGQYGLLGLLVPESLGGSGGTLPDAAAVAAELGRVLVPGPYLHSAVEATSLLVSAQHGAFPETAGLLLERLVAGEATATVLDERAVRRDVTVTGTPDRELVLNGTVATVVGADSAEAFLVPLTVDAESIVVHVAAAAVETMAEPLADVTRRAATVRFTDVPVSPDRVAVRGSQAHSALNLAAARLAVCLAADSAAGAAAILKLATEYAKTRHQFGRPIGSFQAIKHKLADMYIKADSAQSMAERAAELAEDTSSAAARATLAAAAHCTTAYLAVAGDAIQTHGGIGFTWEHVCHRYLKRAWLNQMLLGGRRSLLSSFADVLFAETANH